MLQVRSFKSRDPSAACIDRLCCRVCPRRKIWRRSEIRKREGLGHDRIRKPLVEETARNHAEGIQVVLDEHVEVVARLWLQVWISERHEILQISGAARRCKRQRLCDVLWI